MRALFLATAAILAVPAAAQDHSDHSGHTAAQPAPQEEPLPAPQASAEETDPSTMDHGTMDHGSMAHPQEGPNLPKPDTRGHGSMDHGAMDHGTMDHGTMDHSTMDHSAQPATSAPQQAGPPARAFEGPEHAADEIYGAGTMEPVRRAVARENGGFTGGTVMLERFEARLGEGEDLYLWDAQGWYGGDIDKLWLKSEGEGAFGGGVESAEIQALWSHAIDPWFDVQAGVRYDIEPRGRAHAVLGVQGLAPYMFEVDVAAFLSEKGDLTAGIEAEYDQRITQRLILQPRVEATLSAQNVPELGIGAGLSTVEAGVRLRYEIAREFAPYIGVDYEARLGETADLARAAGEDTGGFAFLLGIRAWF